MLLLVAHLLPLLPAPVERHIAGLAIAVLTLITVSHGDLAFALYTWCRVFRKSIPLMLGPVASAVQTTEASLAVCLIAVGTFSSRCSATFDAL